MMSVRLEAWTSRRKTAHHIPRAGPRCCSRALITASAYPLIFRGWSSGHSATGGTRRQPRPLAAGSGCTNRASGGTLACRRRKGYRARGGGSDVGRTRGIGDRAGEAVPGEIHPSRGWLVHPHLVRLQDRRLDGVALSEGQRPGGLATCMTCSSAALISRLMPSACRWSDIRRSPS
jgi:hypothetical protein